MLTLSTWRTSACAAAALFCVATTAPALSAELGLENAPRGKEAIEFVNAPAAQARGRTVAKAIERFVEGMASRDPEAVWMFASEEDQDAFGTERAVYEAYDETFPAFAEADEVTFGRFWQEGDTPFAEVTLNDTDGKVYRATMGFWLDDAGDWKLISCDVKPLSDRVASR